MQACVISGDPWRENSRPQPTAVRALLPCRAVTSQHPASCFYVSGVTSCTTFSSVAACMFNSLTPKCSGIEEEVQAHQSPAVCSGGNTPLIKCKCFHWPFGIKGDDAEPLSPAGMACPHSDGFKLQRSATASLLAEISLESPRYQKQLRLPLCLEAGGI